jgi:tRNA (mo5U34)-methyltransferase
MPGVVDSELQSRVKQVPFWWHSIDLGGGVITPGSKSAQELERELEWVDFGDLRGKSVLDVGSWDGYFAFAAERQGADRVIAMDHYVWATELAEFIAYRDSCVERGEPVEPAESLPHLWRPSELPGKRGFDLAHEVLDSNVEVVLADLPDCDLDALGAFDVVLYLGGLYHMRHPLLALERLASLTQGVAIIETHATHFRGLERLPICRFIQGDEFNADPSNWWTFNKAALVSLCRAAGFSRAEVVRAPPLWKRRAAAALKGSAPYRAYVRAYR